MSVEPSDTSMILLFSRCACQSLDTRLKRLIPTQDIGIWLVEVRIFRELGPVGLQTIDICGVIPLAHTAVL